MHSGFAAWQEDPATTLCLPDVRPYVFRLSVRNGGTDIWKTFMDIYKEAEDDVLRRDILRSLGHVSTKAKRIYSIKILTVFGLQIGLQIASRLHCSVAHSQMLI